MKVKEILALATAQGAVIGSPYDKGMVIAKDVEGIAMPAVNQQGQPTGGYRFEVKDENDKLSVTIGSADYVAGKTKYDLIVCSANRDVVVGNTVVTKKGDKRLRAA